MKYMIASDIHGSAVWCAKMTEAWEKEKADRLILLGDILYHGPRNDLPDGYAPKEVIAMLNPLKDRILAVRGNCDTEVDQMVLDFPVLADYAILENCGRMIYMTHGHVYNTEHMPPLADGDILLHGHTHIPACKQFGSNNLYMNPGSVSIPKNGTPHGFMILEDGKFLWKDMTGRIFQTYFITETG